MQVAVNGSTAMKSTINTDYDDNSILTVQSCELDGYGNCAISTNARTGLKDPQALSREEKWRKWKY